MVSFVVLLKFEFIDKSSQLEKRLRQSSGRIRTEHKSIIKMKCY